MTEAILILVGLLVGVVIGIYVGILRGRGALSSEVAGLTASLEEVRGQLAAREGEVEGLRKAAEVEKVAGAEANARLEEARKHFVEQRRQIEEMDKRVKDSFAALSAAALKSNNEQFITLAEAKMKPLREQLAHYEKQITELEKTRVGAYTGLTERIKSMGEREDALTQETGRLVAALRHPGAKGKWGELSLQRIVELAGMTEHCDFETQSVQESGRKPDLVVHMPGGRKLAIDSKVNIEAYLEAVGATGEGQRQELLKKYVGAVRGTMRQLGRKEYWRQFSPAPELVVMFMPAEAFFAAAVSQDGDLIADGLENRVLLASPTTLIALLLAVAHGWQQHQMTENAKKIGDAGRELHERLCTFVEHLDDIRDGIMKAAKAYDAAVGSWRRNTLPAVRRLEDLGAKTGEELKTLKETETPMRRFLPEEDGGEINGP